MPPKREGYRWHTAGVHAGHWHKIPKSHRKYRSWQPYKEVLSSLPIENMCSFFGCGRTLSLQESLFGNHCIHHQLITPVVYRYKI